MRQQRQDSTPNVNHADAPLPDLAQLSIAGEDWERSLLFSPASPAIPTSPLSPSSRRCARNREAGYQGCPQADGVTVNINVHVSAAPSINVYNAPLGPEPGQPSAAQPHPAASPAPRTRTAPSSRQAQNGGSSRSGGSGRGVRYTIRAGGKARVDWVPCLEHVDDGYAPRGKKWYVVTAGLRVGVWRNWVDMADYIDVNGCRYQSCASKEEAVELYDRAKREGRVCQLIK